MLEVRLHLLHPFVRLVMADGLVEMGMQLEFLSLLHHSLRGNWQESPPAVDLVHSLRLYHYLLDITPGELASGNDIGSVITTLENS